MDNVIKLAVILTLP